jgi:hypothetical protein
MNLYVSEGNPRVSTRLYAGIHNFAININSRIDGSYPGYVRIETDFRGFAIQLSFAAYEKL